jgi:hypothetical protein
MAVITESDKVAAAILACEASRQHQEEIKAGPGRQPSSRDIAGELWSFFEHFIGRLSDKQP